MKNRTGFARSLVGMFLLGMCRLALGQANLPDDFAVAQPKIPDGQFSIMDYGAVGDGTTMNTAAFAKAIEACSKAGGGTLTVPAGKFLTGPFTLTSNLNLHLDKGSTILLSNNPSDYKLKNDRLENCIFAENCHDLEITGDGVIDGQGEPFWKSFSAAKNGPPGTKYPPHRPFLIVINRCQRVRVAGVTLTNSPMFHLVPEQCRDMTIDGIKIKSPEHAPNTDGIDPSGINFIIKNCLIDSGDDNIALKATGRVDKDQPACENFLIQDCTFVHGHGMSVGGQTPGGLRNMLVRRCSFESTDAGMRLKAGRGHGGLVENITYEDLTMKNVKVALLFTSFYPEIPAHPEDDPAQDVSATTPIWRHIRVNRVTSKDGQIAARILGLKEMPIEDVVITDTHITAAKPAQIIHAKGIKLVNSSIAASSGAAPVIFDAEVEGLDSSGK